MKKLLFAFFALVLAACGGTVTPKVLDSTLIGAFNEANKAAEVFDGKITAGVKSGDFASIAGAADAALEVINKQIEKLNSLNAPENGKSYKEATVNSLNTLKEVVETGRKYSELKEGYSSQEFAGLENEYNDKRKQLSQELAQVAVVAKAFAQASK